MEFTNQTIMSNNFGDLNIMPTITTKVPNYTPEQTAIAVARYLAGGRGMESADFDARDKIVKELKVELKKNERSIRSKLTREKTADGEQVYIARATVSKVTNEAPAKKDVMAVALVKSAGDVSGVSKQSLNSTSVEKMNKPEIAIITAQFNAMNAKIENLEGELDDMIAHFGFIPDDSQEENSEES